MREGQPDRLQLRAFTVGEERARLGALLPTHPRTPRPVSASAFTLLQSQVRTIIIQDIERHHSRRSPDTLPRCSKFTVTRSPITLCTWPTPQSGWPGCRTRWPGLDQEHRGRLSRTPPRAATGHRHSTRPARRTYARHTSRSGPRSGRNARGSTGSSRHNAPPSPSVHCSLPWLVGGRPCRPRPAGPHTVKGKPLSFETAPCARHPARRGPGRAWLYHRRQHERAHAGNRRGHCRRAWLRA